MEPAPVFVKISKYQDVTAVLQKIQQRLDTTNKMLLQLEHIKNEEDERLQEWKESLELVQNKLDTIEGSFQ